MVSILITYLFVGFQLEIIHFTGFELPSDQIYDSGRETFEALISLALHIKKQINATTYNLEDFSSNSNRIEAHSLVFKGILIILIIIPFGL
jgi:hypothetical protein